MDSMDNLFPLVLDGIILVLLVGTMVFSARLSIYLKSFRDSRHGLEVLVKELSGSIDKADRSIQSLSARSHETGKDIQAAIDDAVRLKDELQLMNEYGDKLAVRLEKLLEKRGDVPSDPERSPVPSFSTIDDSVSEHIGDTSEGIFRIRDIDVDRGEVDSGLEFGGDEEFSSQAEKDLYNALRHNEKNKTGSMS